jgi:hypothetical protein
MTAADLRNPPPSSASGRAPGWPPPVWLRAPGLRLVRLHLVSRGVPTALAVLAAIGVVMRLALFWHWSLGSGTGGLSVPLILESGAAAVIAITTRSPLGEPERATGRWLPWLRAGTVVALTAIAFGALCAGAAGAGLDGGTLDVLRNLAGVTGLGLLSATVTGGALAWVAPLVYMVIGQFGLVGGWTTPWVWPARPPLDRGAAICAGLVFAAGLAVITVRGARDRIGED